MPIKGVWFIIRLEVNHISSTRCGLVFKQLFEVGGWLPLIVCRLIRLCEVVFGRIWNEHLGVFLRERGHDDAKVRLLLGLLSDSCRRSFIFLKHSKGRAVRHAFIDFLFANLDVFDLHRLYLFNSWWFLLRRGRARFWILDLFFFHIGQLRAIDSLFGLFSAVIRRDWWFQHNYSRTLSCSAHPLPDHGRTFRLLRRDKSDRIFLLLRQFRLVKIQVFIVNLCEFKEPLRGIVIASDQSFALQSWLHLLFFLWSISQHLLKTVELFD